MLCEELTARPKETHLQPEITPSSLNISQNGNQEPPQNLGTLPGWLQHARAHTHTSQSVSLSGRCSFLFYFLPLCVFFCLFFSSFFFFFYWEGSFSFLSFFLNRERRDDSKKGKWQWGVISKGNTTMLIALGPWKKEREKEGEFFLVEDGGHQICYVYKKGLNVRDTGKSFFLYKYFLGIQNVQLVKCIPCHLHYWRI